MIREPYNLNPYNSTIDTSKVNNFSFTFSGDELGSWNIEIAKNNTSPEIVYTSEEFVPEDVGYTHIYDGDIVEGITLPSTIAHRQGDDGLLRRLYSINGYPFDEAVVKLNVNGIENIGNIKGSTTNGYLVATNYSLGRTGDGVTIIGFDKDGTTIGSQVTDGTYDFLGYLLSVKTNSNIQVGQVVQIEGNSFIIGSIEDVGDGYSELTIVNGEATFLDTASIASFDSLTEADVTELTVGIEPVQDLNGYDAPWVGGAGKNKLNFNRATTTLNGVTFTNNGDGTYTVSGTSTGITVLEATVTLGVAQGIQLILNGCPSGGSSNTYALDTYGTDISLARDYGSGGTFTANGSTQVVRIVVFANATMNNLVFKPMIRLATETDATFAPYSNICPITGHDEVTVTDVGKNLLDPDAFASGRSQYYNVNSDGSINVVANDSTAWNNVPYIPLKAGTYTLSWVTQPSGQLRMKTSDDGYSAESYIGAGNKRYTFTLTDDGGIKLKIGINASHPYTEYLQLELGSTATAYEPYRSNTYTTSLGQTVYGGTLDVVSGVLTVDRAMVDLGSLSWSMSGSGNTAFFYANTASLGVASDITTSLNYICENYSIVAVSSGGTATGMAFTSASQLRIRDATYSDATSFKTAMNGVQLVYQLATPVEYQLTAQQIQTLLGTNNVWASSGDIVSITFTYNIN